MTRLALLLVLIVAIAPAAAAQVGRVPTPQQITRLERTVADRVDDSTSARRAANRLSDDDSDDERENAGQRVRDANSLLKIARDTLASASQRLAEAADRAEEDRAAVDAAEDATAGTSTGSQAAAGRETAGPPGSTDGGQDDPPPTPGPWYKDLTILGLVASLLALAGAVVWWFTQRRGTGGAPPRSSIGHAQGLDLERRILGQTVARREFQTLAEQVQAQKKELGDLRTWMTDYYTKAEAARTAIAAAPPVAATAAAPVLAPAEAAAAAFMNWCRRATPMMHRVEFFDRDLAERLPGAAARAVLRDLNSQAEPVRFDGQGGASPAEFWLVTASGESLLFPQPLNAMQFRDLTRVFEGSAAPAALASVAPARVRDDGASFSLVAPGRVA